MLKRFIDHHVHTEFSPDSKTTMVKLISRAKALNLKALMFTDHVDFDSADPLFKKTINYDQYGEMIVRQKKAHQDLDILTGVEIGYQSHLHDRLRNFLRSYPFEFVICSMHCIDGLDFYNGDFFKGKTQHGAYHAYFLAVLKSIENYDDFDVYGHLDHIVRYGDFLKKEIEYRAFQEVIDEILRTLINKGKGIELNTSGLRYGLGAMHPVKEILKRYRDLGGEIITLGSDAHRDMDLQANFKEALDLLKDLDYRAVAEFRQRTPVFLDI